MKIKWLRFLIRVLGFKGKAHERAEQIYVHYSHWTE